MPILSPLEGIRGLSLDKEEIQIFFQEDLFGLSLRG